MKTVTRLKPNVGDTHAGFWPPTPPWWKRPETYWRIIWVLVALCLILGILTQDLWAPEVAKIISRILGW